MNNLDKLLWLPIDVPKFPYPDFDINSLTDWHYWNYNKITVEKNSPYEISTIKEEVIEQYPDIENWFGNLPFSSIRNIKYNLQKFDVKPHIDFTKPDDEPSLFLNNKMNEPCGYRILLRGARQNSLYVMDNEEKIYTTLPEETDVYVLRHSDGSHGVEEEINRATIFTHFEIDSELHSEILKRSILKYGKYAVWTK